MTRSARRSSPRLVDEAMLRRWPLPKLGQDADKTTRGDVLVVGGSTEIPGAVLLAGVAALRVGAGRVRIATPRGAALAIAATFPEARVIGLAQTQRGELSKASVHRLRDELDECSALVLGPGMRDHGPVPSILSESIRANHGFTAVLDAAALHVFRERKPLPHRSLAGVIATPHAGEMADLWGCPREEVHQHGLALAVEAAKKMGVTVVLKGTTTFIVDPDGSSFRNVAGNSGLATAGSGDTLSGMIAGLAARGATPVQSAVWGVYLHAKAGDALKRKLGPLGYLARELSAELPGLLRRLDKAS